MQPYPTHGTPSSKHACTNITCETYTCHSRRLVLGPGPGGVWLECGGNTGHAGNFAPTVLAPDISCVDMMPDVPETWASPAAGGGPGALPAAVGRQLRAAAAEAQARARNAAKVVLGEAGLGAAGGGEGQQARRGPSLLQIHMESDWIVVGVPWLGHLCDCVLCVSLLAPFQHCS